MFCVSRRRETWPSRVTNAGLKELTGFKKLQWLQLPGRLHPDKVPYSRFSFCLR